MEILVLEEMLAHQVKRVIGAYPLKAPQVWKANQGREVTGVKKASGDSQDLQVKAQMDLLVQKEVQGHKVQQVMMGLQDQQEKKVKNVAHAPYHPGDPREIMVVLVNEGSQGQ